MKSIIFLSLILLASSCADMAQNDHSKQKIAWVLDVKESMPESVFVDKDSNQIFVSHIVGGPGDKDGNGYISTISTNGEIKNLKWATQLNAPKGMRVSKKTLWVSDIDRVLGFNVDTGKLETEVAIKDAKFLNDVAVDKSGHVFVSDMMTNTIHVISKGKLLSSIKNESFENPNGLLVLGNDLYIASWGPISNPETFETSKMGNLLKMNLKSKKIEAVTKAPLGNLDGLEIDQNGNFIVSDWVNGKVYRIANSGDKKGEAELLYSGDQGSADLGILTEQKLILLPSMLEGKIKAIEL